MIEAVVLISILIIFNIIPAIGSLVIDFIDYKTQLKRLADGTATKSEVLAKIDNIRPLNYFTVLLFIGFIVIPSSIIILLIEETVSYFKRKFDQRLTALEEKGKYLREVDKSLIGKEEKGE